MPPGDPRRETTKRRSLDRHDIRNSVEVLDGVAVEERTGGVGEDTMHADVPGHNLPLISRLLSDLRSVQVGPLTVVVEDGEDLDEPRRGRSWCAGPCLRTRRVAALARMVRSPSCGRLCRTGR